MRLICRAVRDMYAALLQGGLLRLAADLGDNAAELLSFYKATGLTRAAIIFCNIAIAAKPDWLMSELGDITLDIQGYVPTA